MRKLIVTCDDCGISEGINNATFDLFERGFATAATIVTNFPATQHALDLLVGHQSLDIGVHLNLTDGLPLTDIASKELTGQDGNFNSKSGLFQTALFSRESFLEAVETELKAQINVFVDKGIQPNHLTTHLHFHSIAPLRRIVYKLGHQFNIQWVRNSDLRRAIVPMNVFLSGDNANDDDSIASPDYFAPLQAWVKYSKPEKFLDKLLSVEGSLEVILHPCYEEDSTFPETVNYDPSSRYSEMMFYVELFKLMQVKTPHTFQFAAGLK